MEPITIKKRIITLALFISTLGFTTNISADSYAQIPVYETKNIFNNNYDVIDTTESNVGIYMNTQPYILDAIKNTSMNGLDSDFEKVRLIESYIRKILEYDTQAAKESDSWEENYTAFTNYCLLTNKAVCAGYAEAFQSMCLAVGIECWYVTGYATNNNGDRQYHAWNKVKIDNVEYYVDACWNDSASGRYSISETLWEDHEIDEIYEQYHITSKSFPQP